MPPEIKKLLAALLLVLAAGCAVENPGTPPVIDRLHYPVSVAVIQSDPTSEGTLYVVNSNFDLRFTRGWVTALDVGAALAAPPGPLTGLVQPGNVVFTDSFGGELGVFHPAGATATQHRLFLPTRSEHRLFVLNADGTALGCAAPVEGSPADCSGQGISLVESDATGTFDPFQAVVRGGQVFVSPLRRAIPPGEDTGLAWLAMLDAENPTTPQFISVGDPPSQALVGTPAGLFLSGRAIVSATSIGSKALRFLPLDGGELTVVNTGLTDATRIQETRGLGLSSDGRRLFVSTRGPDATTTLRFGPDGLLILDITSSPVRVLDFKPLPQGPGSLVVLPRAGRPDVVAISCSTDDKVAFYDDELGEIVALVDSQAPAGIAQAAAPSISGRRVFVASFEGQTVDVIDLPNFDTVPRIVSPPQVRRIGAGVD